MNLLCGSLRSARESVRPHCGSLYPKEADGKQFPDSSQTHEAGRGEEAQVESVDLVTRCPQDGYYVAAVTRHEDFHATLPRSEMNSVTLARNIPTTHRTRDSTVLIRVRPGE